jgi:hypothetical protein
MDMRSHQIQAESFSLYAEGHEEALKFKWIESQKANRDLGEFALWQWSRAHWQPFLRSRWIEHLEGKRFCSELNADQFALLQRPFTNHGLLLERILDRLKSGQENLEIINWAVECEMPCQAVCEILGVLKLNDLHLPSPFEHLAC